MGRARPPRERGTGSSPQPVARRGRRGRCRRRTRRSSSARRRPGARRAITRTPRRPTTGTCRTSTTLAVTRSRTSSRSRRGSAMAKLCSRRGWPQRPTSATRKASVSRSQSAASTSSQGSRVAVEVERVAGAAERARRRRPRSRPAPAPPAPPVPWSDCRRATSRRAHRPVAQGAAVLLEGDQLAEHLVVVRRPARPGWCAGAATSPRRSAASP